MFPARALCTAAREVERERGVAELLEEYRGKVKGGVYTAEDAFALGFLAFQAATATPAQDAERHREGKGRERGDDVVVGSGWVGVKGAEMLPQDGAGFRGWVRDESKRLRERKIQREEQEEERRCRGETTGGAEYAQEYELALEAWRWLNESAALGHPLGHYFVRAVVLYLASSAAFAAAVVAFVAVAMATCCCCCCCCGCGGDSGSLIALGCTLCHYCLLHPTHP